MNTNNTTRSKLNLLLATMGMVFAGCAYGGEEAADDSVEVGTEEAPQTWGVGGFQIPRKLVEEQGDTVISESGTCELAIPVIPTIGVNTVNAFAVHYCINQVSREQCVGGHRMLDGGIVAADADCERNGVVYECSASATVKCVFKAPQNQ